VTPFDLVEATTLGEAVSLLDIDDPSVRPIAGGTALMLMMKAGVFKPSRLISLGRIEKQYSMISINDGELRIGAMTSLSSLETSSEVKAAFPVIAETLRAVANVRVRNVACIGGALAHGDPHMDLPPLLSVLDARAVVIGPGGSREIGVEALYSGYFQTVLEPNELIAEVIVPRQARRAAYLKYTTRTVDDWPALGIAVALEIEGQLIRDANLVISAATEKVTRLVQTEKVLAGAAIEDAALKRAGEAAVAETTLISDSRGSAVYKQELLRVCVGRAVRMALANGGGE
jgi:carbon-monoxide dehydrogenase medium subunit